MSKVKIVSTVGTTISTSCLLANINVSAQEEAFWPCLFLMLFRKFACNNLSFSGLFFQLEEVMETETYKNAKLILERFDPEAKKKAVSSVD